MLVILVVLMHNNTINGDALLKARLHVSIELAQNNGPQWRQRQIEQVTIPVKSKQSKLGKLLQSLHFRQSTLRLKLTCVYNGRLTAPNTDR